MCDREEPGTGDGSSFHSGACSGFGTGDGSLFYSGILKLLPVKQCFTLAAAGFWTEEPSPGSPIKKQSAREGESNGSIFKNLPLS